MRFSLLDPLRGLAALWVFAYHYDFATIVRESLPFFHAILKQGQLGVPMFFVISGYCLAAAAIGSLERNESSWQFLKRRVRRIYPTYWCAILVAVAVPFVLALLTAVRDGNYTPPSPALRTNGFLSYSFSDWLAVASLLRVFDASAGADSLQSRFNTINAVYWTLAIEVQFYFVVTAAKLARKRFHLVLALVALAGFASARLFPEVWNKGLFLQYWPQYWFGTVVCWLLQHGRHPTAIFGRRVKPIGIGVTALLVCGFLWQVHLGKSIDETIFAAGFAVALYFSHTWDATFRECLTQSRWRGVRAMLGVSVAVGAMSYSIYLLHGRVRFVSMQWLRQVFPADSAIIDCGVFVLTCGFCWIFYRYCERPFASSNKRKADTATTVSAFPTEK